jgi:HD-like signal output (HDOD) protein
MTDTAELNAAAFKFVQNMAEDLGKDDLELPGFPDSVARLHQDLADESKGVKDIVERVSTEPALAARLIQLANSAAFNTTGREVGEPRAAVTQLGFNIVRSTATAYAMRQIEQQEWLQPVRPELAKIWRRSNGVAAICHVLGDEIDGLRADEALAAGLFHQLGNLYLLTRAHGEGLDIAGNPNWEQTTRSWHPTIARAFMESWGMPDYLGEAVENQDGIAAGDNENLTLYTRLLSCAKLYDSLKEASNGVATKIEAILEPVQLSGLSFLELARDRADRIADVRATIS